MDDHDPQPGELAALTQRVVNLERLVSHLASQLRGAGSVAARPAPLRPQPVPPPPPPMPGFAQPAPVAFAPARPAKSLEDRLGSQVFNMVGIFALICGSAYFLKLAIDHGWIGPVARILIGLIAGAGLVVWSENFRRKNLPAFSYSLKAVGTAVLYLSLWAAFQLYHLLPGPVVLAAMILVTAWNAWMAVRQDAELLAGYALAGGLLTPLLLSTGGNHETFLFTYLAAIALGVVYLLRGKTWAWLLIPTFLGVAGFFIGWYAEFFHPRTADAWNGASTETALFALLFFAIFALPTIKGWSTLPEPATSSPAALVSVLLPFTNAAFLALALYSVFEDSGLHSSLAFLMVALAAVFLGMMRLQRATIASALYLAVAVICLTVAVPLKAHGHALTTAWLVEGLILYWASTRFDQQDKAPVTVLWVLSLAGYVLGLGSLVAHWGLDMLTNSQPAFFSSNLAAALVAVATLAGAAWLLYRRGDNGAVVVPLLALDGAALLLALREIVGWNAALPHPFLATPDFFTALLGLAILVAITWGAFRVSQGRSPVAAGNFILANLLAILIGTRELDVLFTGHYADLERSLASSGFLLLYGAALLTVGFLRRSAFIRWQGLVLLLFTVLKVFLIAVGSLGPLFRVFGFLGLGAVLMAVSYAYQKDWLGLKTTDTPPPPVIEEHP